MSWEQLRLDDALPVEGGGKPLPLKRWLGVDEVWWKPGTRFHCREVEPLRYDHIAAYVRFGSFEEAEAEGAGLMCPRCRRSVDASFGSDDDER